MKHFILQCEVGKENQILPYCDAIILGINPSFSEAVMEELSTFHPHFDGLSVGYVVLPQTPEIQGKLIQHCIQRGSKVLLLGANPDHYTHLSAVLSELHCISNRIVGLSLPIASHNLGFQRHLVSKEVLYELEQQSADSASLGLLTEDFLNAEAMLRTCSALYLDGSVCKAAHVPGYGHCQPAGLEAEQLIQLVRYASHSSQLSIVGFACDTQPVQSLASLYATCIWYFLEGLHQGIHTPDSATEITYVNLREFDEVLEFAFDAQAQKWWVRIEQESGSPFIACTLADHEEAVKGSLTARLHRLLFELR